MIRDVNIDNRKIYLLYGDSKYLLYPQNTLFPSDELFPAEYTRLANVVQGSIKLNEIIADNELKFGKILASQFEVRVYDTPDISGKFLIVYQEDNGIYKGIFAGQIISCKLDNTGLDRTIVAYDLSYYYREKNVAAWWINFWENKETSTIGECRESLCANLGINFENVVLPNDDITITKNVELSYITFADVLFMLCELNGCFPHFNRDSILEFIMLDTEEEPTDITGLYEGLNSNFEDYTTAEITGIQYFDSDNDLKYSYGDMDNPYKMSSNIFTYGMGTAQLNAISANLMDYLSELSYTPARVKMVVGDLSFHLGQKIHTDKGDFFILENQYSASQLVEESIIARGTERLEERTKGLGNSMIVVNEKIAKVEFDVEHLAVEFADIAAGLSSRITQNAESITTEVTRATGAENGLSSRITQTADAITTEVTNRQNADNGLSSRIDQTVQAISLKVSKGDVSSQLSIESGQITLASGRLIINTGNFRIDSNGTITCYNANLTGGQLSLGGSRDGKIEMYDSRDRLRGKWTRSGFYLYDSSEDEIFEATSDGVSMTGELHTGDIDIYDSYIKYDRDNFIDLGGSPEGIHINGDGIFFSTDDIAVTNYRGSTSLHYGVDETNIKVITDISDNGDGTISWSWGYFDFIHGICTSTP